MVYHPPVETEPSITREITRSYPIIILGDCSYAVSSTFNCLSTPRTPVDVVLYCVRLSVQTALFYYCIPPLLFYSLFILGVDLRQSISLRPFFIVLDLRLEFGLLSGLLGLDDYSIGFSAAPALLLSSIRGPKAPRSDISDTLHIKIKSIAYQY